MSLKQRKNELKPVKTKTDTVDSKVYITVLIKVL